MQEFASNQINAFALCHRACCMCVTPHLRYWGQIMTSTYEIPTEIRDFAERSVSQARKAFEGFIGAVHKTAETVDSAGVTAQAGTKDLTAKAVSYAETNVGAAFDLAEKMVRAKDVQEVMALQSDYLKAQFAALQAQTKELGEAVVKATGVKS